MNKKLLNFVKAGFIDISKDLLKNPQGLRVKLDAAIEKLNKQQIKDALGKNVEDLKVLVRMTKSWLNKDYREISVQSIIYTIAAIVYFVTPTDFMPDFIMGLGLLDDIAVLRWVMNQIKSDIDKYKQWERGKKLKESSSNRQKAKTDVSK
ncbi:MAG: DUF1232 domain-containing protein [Bacteriovoracaceae bacterium]|nr:DUF1232 domain-containing protein [Bacteriovoracaceae bacterium]